MRIHERVNDMCKSLQLTLCDTQGQLFEVAAERGYKRLQFQSEATNPNAMEFYVSLGYSPADMKFYVKYFE